MRSRLVLIGIVGVLVATCLGCADSSAHRIGPVVGRALRVVAAENFWGSIAQQVGASAVSVTSVITDPAADPHDYEPTPADARAMAGADLVIVNGVGYDPWATTLLAASPGPIVLNVGDLVGAKDGDNPHLWYNPGDVRMVIAALTEDLQKLDPTGDFAQQRQRFETVTLHQYNGLIATIKKRYGGTEVGASESIFAMLAPALGLRLVTPPTFLRAISEGSDVSASDKRTIDRQIASRQIKIYVYNSQNATPDVQAQLEQCRAEHIPIASITETMSPATTTYQQWQSTQLAGIQDALAKAAT
ncbi:MAG TPA: zinc ABC transporter substrate-binding protein [Frankiaceae bacterium]|nr:zinc ABC transporter substrate-binding protein [Frankiaceae bacterium]